MAKSEQERAVWEVTQLRGWEVIKDEIDQMVRIAQEDQKTLSLRYHNSQITRDEFAEESLKAMAKERSYTEVLDRVARLCG
ncbi:hypothetical protein KAU11_10295 [Candidatus Babeliales bacterium]|nr:hypothetical protein [Candidatus Babeliales bacterium]